MVLLVGGAALAKQIQGDAKDNRLVGTNKRDRIYGFGGNDTINSVDGRANDIVSCGPGTDDQVLADKGDGVSGDCERLTRR